MSVSIDVAAQDQYALYESPDTTDSASDKCHDDADDAFFGVTKIKLVNSPRTKENSQESCCHFTFLVHLHPSENYIQSPHSGPCLIQLSYMVLHFIPIKAEAVLCQLVRRIVLLIY